MAYEPTIERYRHWYAKLLRLYPKPHYERFSEGMEQTFIDLLRERVREKKGIDSWAIWVFVETTAGIIRDTLTFTIMQTMTKRLGMWAIIVAMILMIPLVAMQFTTEVQWTGSDFLFMGTLIFGVGVLFELARKRAAGNTAYKAAAGMALLGTFLLIWVNAAVGIIGDSEVNMLYAFVPATLFIGGIAARLKPRGMSYTLFAAALVQATIPAIALIIGTPDFSPGVLVVFILNAFWVMLFIGSGLLFRQANVTISQSNF